MCKYKELFDLSSFPVSSKYYCSNNKKVVCKIKGEYGGKSIVKFAGLESKMYSILDQSANKDHNPFMSFKNSTIYYLRKRFFDTQ